MSPTLSDFQRRFVQALSAPPGEGPAWAAQPGFAVYRNTVMKGCLDALEANFPAVVRLVGHDWFRSAAALHVADAWPDDPRLARYGAQFPAFLDTFEPAAAWPYLASVARLDRWWTESHLAAEAAPVDSAWLAGLAPDALAGTRLRPHPATRWVWFADQPAYSIWAANRAACDDPAARASLAGLVWQGEGALLTRPRGAVVWAPASVGACAFLEACAAGAYLGEAAGAAAEAQPGIDIAPLLGALLRAGALQR